MSCQRSGLADVQELCLQISYTKQENDEWRYQNDETIFIILRRFFKLPI